MGRALPLRGADADRGGAARTPQGERHERMPRRGGVPRRAAGNTESVRPRLGKPEQVNEALQAMARYEIVKGVIYFGNA